MMTAPVSVDIIEDVPYKGAGTPPSSGWQPYDTVKGWGGKADAHAWFRVRVRLPEGFPAVKKRLLFRDSMEGNEAANPQFLVYEGDKIVSGLDARHLTLPVSGDVEWQIYAYTGMKIAQKLFIIAEVQAVDEATEQLYYDMRALLDTAAMLPQESDIYIRILDVLNEAADRLDFAEPHSPSYDAGVSAARQVLREYFARKKCVPAAVVRCVGHTHIDVAWLWTVEQSREKAQRSFATALRLMDEYPEYVFMSSQPVLYEFVRQYAPDVYARICKRVKEGRWEPEGGMWLEADCNLPSGESLVRQLYYGKKFFRDEFGRDSEIVWLPDAFGYPASLPQIFVKSGMRWFVTSKISWSDTNRMPHDVFYWQGIDGTCIPCYFLTAQDKRRGELPRNITTYNAMAEPKQIAGAWERFQDKSISDEVLLTYGYGDGGGGPTAEHLECLRRTSAGIDGCPVTENGGVRTFFDCLEPKLKDRAAVWRGELYLEFHRGTFTAMAKNKRLNRKFEYRLTNAEWMSVVLRRPYDGAIWESLWKKLLLNQFHDILPGSGIGEIYEESDRLYAVLEDELSLLEKELADEITAGVNSDGGYLVLNPNGHAMTGVVETEKGTYLVHDVPAKGWTVVSPGQLQGDTSVSVGEHILENALLRVTFDDGYCLASVIDKRNGQELLTDAGNVLQVFDQHLEYEFNAWEIKNYYDRVKTEIRSFESAEPFDEGAVKGMRIVRRYRTSTIEQRIFLTEGSAVLTFDTRLDWNDAEIMLKADFPVGVNAEYAECDIQFGTVKRPVYRNTSWDAAKFEVCAHKFADLSQGDYGVALMNDCKYGYDFTAGHLRLTLLRTPVDPNPAADIGRHEFRYALYPHPQAFCDSDVVRKSCEFNNPLIVQPIGRHKGALPATFSLISVDVDNVIVDAVKPCADGFIVRMYETMNKRASVHIRTGVSAKRIAVCDLMENELYPLETPCVNIAPYEIVSLKFFIRE